MGVALELMAWGASFGAALLIGFGVGAIYADHTSRLRHVLRERRRARELRVAREKRAGERGDG